MASGTINSKIGHTYESISSGVNVFPNVTFFRIDNTDIKVIKAGVQLASALTGGTAYTVVTAANYKSVANWYHEVVLGRDSQHTTAYFGYLNIDTSGNVRIIPCGDIPAGDYIWLSEYYL